MSTQEDKARQKLFNQMKADKEEQNLTEATDEFEQGLVEWSKDGKTPEEIAKLFDIPVQDVRKALKKYGIG